MADAFGGSRIQVKPPERGVFALDHDGECKDFMKIYLKCLKDKNAEHHDCKDESKSYLNCRMETGLMAKEDLNNLGFGEESNYKRKNIEVKDEREGGFIAGTGVRVRKWF